MEFRCVNKNTGISGSPVKDTIGQILWQKTKVTAPKRNTKYLVQQRGPSDQKTNECFQVLPTLLSAHLQRFCHCCPSGCRHLLFISLDWIYCIFQCFPTFGWIRVNCLRRFQGSWFFHPRKLRLSSVRIRDLHGRCWTGYSFRVQEDRTWQHSVAMGVGSGSLLHWAETIFAGLWDSDYRSKSPGILLISHFIPRVLILKSTANH